MLPSSCSVDVEVVGTGGAARMRATSSASSAASANSTRLAVGPSRRLGAGRHRRRWRTRLVPTRPARTRCRSCEPRRHAARRASSHPTRAGPWSPSRGHPVSIRQEELPIDNVCNMVQCAASGPGAERHAPRTFTTTPGRHPRRTPDPGHGSRSLSCPGTGAAPTSSVRGSSESSTRGLVLAASRSSGSASSHCSITDLDDLTTARCESRRARAALPRSSGDLAWEADIVAAYTLERTPVARRDGALAHEWAAQMRFPRR